MFIEYLAIALAFGISSYFCMYTVARKRALVALKRKKDNIPNKVFSFFAWSGLASILMPLMLPSYFLRYSRTQEILNNKILEASAGK